MKLRITSSASDEFISALAIDAGMQRLLKVVAPDHSPAAALRSARLERLNRAAQRGFARSSQKTPGALSLAAGTLASRGAA